MRGSDAKIKLHPDEFVVVIGTDGWNEVGGFVEYIVLEGAMRVGYRMRAISNEEQIKS